MDVRWLYICDMYHILILEDELKTVKTISQGLSEEGYIVDYALDGEEGLALASKNYYDLIITDILMPKMDGIEFCRKVRERAINAPVLMLSALSLTEDKLKGFDAGGDDYMIKPFDFDELLARIKVLLRRTKLKQDHPRVLTYAHIQLNLATKEVFIGDKTVELTAKEFALLEYFMLHKEEVLSKEQIIGHVWGLDFDTGTNILEVYISYLRNKIDKHSTDKLLHTRKGLGYMLKSLADHEDTH